MNLVSQVNRVWVAALAAIFVAAAQTPQQLAEAGHCREAVPALKSAIAKTADPDVRKRMAIDGVRCGMTLNELDTALGFLAELNKQFPDDPEVLYLSVHVFSDLSLRASQRLIAADPSSYQVHELNAEALETQGKWSEAAAEYREVLKRNPDLPGIHYRIGRLLLSNPKSAAATADARREFEEELKIDPRNAGAEYVLGELARRDGLDQAAIDHFRHAATLDAGFADAFIGLGRTLLADGRTAEAIPALESAVKLNPNSAMAHYELATAYSRSGRKEEAAREYRLQKQANEKQQQADQRVREGIAGAPPKP
ncbi:MAG TPA: tetratricopeptide repeat protein [Bryobacteraceae bacterium]|nr:tetratricopeptide repeat protein [Bryobacteraceae bacterium]